MKVKMNSLAKSSMTYVIATALGQGSSFLAMILFTHLMSQGDYGRYSTYYAYVSILTTLAGVNLYFSINNAYIDFKDSIYEFRKSVLALSTITVGSLLVIFVLIHCFLLRDVPFWLIAFAVIHAYSFFVVNYRIYSANMENDWSTKTKLLVIPNVLQLVFSLVFVIGMRDMQYYARVIGSTFGVAICALPSYISMMRYKGRLIVKKYWKYALGIALPSLIMSLSGLLMQQCDKVMITRFKGEEVTAVYSVIYYFSYAIIAVNQAFSEVRRMWVYHKLGRHDTSSANCFQKWYLIFFAILFVCVFMFAPEVMRLIFPEAYWEYGFVTPFVLSASLIILEDFYSEIGSFYKENFKLSLITLIAAILNISLNTILIPIYGSIAAAYTTVVSYMVSFVLLQRMAGKLQEKLYLKKYFYEFFFFTCICGFSFFILKDKIVIRYLFFIAVLILIAIYVCRKKNEWIRYIRR